MLLTGLSVATVKELISFAEKYVYLCVHVRACFCVCVCVCVRVCVIELRVSV